MMIRVDVDEATHDRLEALARLVDLPVGDIVHTLSYAKFEMLLQLSGVPATAGHVRARAAVRGADRRRGSVHRGERVVRCGRRLGAG